MATKQSKQPKFPALSTSRTYTYNSTEVCSITTPISLNHYYVYDKKTKKIEIANLSPNHFNEKLYKNVTPGSHRYWLLELRKFDYNFLHAIRGLAYGTSATIPTTKVHTHEQKWKQIVEDWYKKYETGEDETSATSATPATTTIGSATSHSKYTLNTKSNNDRELTIAEAIAIGKNKAGHPIFYKVLHTKYTDEIDCVCGVRVQDLKNIRDTKYLSEKFWILERMRYDYGDPFHPVAPDFGMLGADWKGVEYKFLNGLHNIANTDIISYHEKGWLQWVNAVYAKAYSQGAPTTNTTNRTYDTFKHNAKMISRLSAEQINEISAACPEYIINHMPPRFYKDAITHIINTIDSEMRFSPIDKRAVKAILALLEKIKVYDSTPTGCANINLSNVITALSFIDPHGSLMTAIILTSKIIKYNMLPGNDADLLSGLITKLNPAEPAKSASPDYTTFDHFCKKNNIDNPLSIYSAKSNAISDIFDEFDEKINNVKKKYNLR